MRIIMAMSDTTPVSAEVEHVGRRVIGAAIEVHRAHGPGFKEPIYVESLCVELDARGLRFEREKCVTVLYAEREVGKHRLDLLVENVLIVECKVAECLKKIHTRQVTSYLKATKLHLGFIFNFNVDVLMPGGFKRVVL
jgi:GxxExxY protein